MRILVTPTHDAHTGSSTYAGLVCDLLQSDPTLRIQGAQEPLPGDATLLHVLDAKSVLGDPRFLDFRGTLIVDLHDAYWTGSPAYPAFDAPLRRRRWRYQRPRFLALLARADLVVVHSRAMVNALPELPCRHIPIPVDPHTPLSNPPEPNGRTLRVLFAGRDSLRKGLPVLAAALRGFPDPVQLRIAGSDFPHLRLASRWWTRGLRVDRAGALDAAGMSAAYDACDLVALPAYTEAFGLVAQEALARGIPVVASRVGGLAEQLDVASGAIAVPPGDPEALREALRSIAADRTGWRERAQRDRTRLLATRSPAMFRDALTEAHDSVLGREGHGP